MPQPYWTNAFDLKEFGEGLARAGGLPQGIGLSFCGPDVISERITVESVERARSVLGLTGAKAQIYDNLPRGGRLDAYSGRDPDLATVVDCVFSERGTPVTRITMYDYLWNPRGVRPRPLAASRVPRARRPRPASLPRAVRLRRALEHGTRRRDAPSA